MEFKKVFYLGHSKKSLDPFTGRICHDSDRDHGSANDAVPMALYAAGLQCLISGMKRAFVERREVVIAVAEPDCNCCANCGNEENENKNPVRKIFHNSENYSLMNRNDQPMYASSLRLQYSYYQFSKFI